MLRRNARQIDLINKWVPRWSKSLARTFAVTVEATGPYIGDGATYPGRGNDGVGRIFICNHRSSCDIPVMFTLIEAHAISRHDLADWPILGRGARRVGTLFVDRESRRSGADVLRKTDAALDAGEGVMMFPEGTSFIGDEVRPFRPGAFKAAQRAGAQIVPVGIAYDNDAVYYYKEPFLTHLSRLATQRAIRVAAVAGEPMTTVGRDPVELKEEAHATMQQLVNQARRRLGGATSPHCPEATESAATES